MPQRKRLEDDLRSVWEEWSTPHDYGLWHEHKEPTIVEKAAEAVGASQPEEKAPEPPSEFAPASSEPPHGGAGSTPAAKQPDAKSSPAQRIAGRLRQKASIGDVKATVLNLAAIRKAGETRAPSTSDVPVISHAMIKSDIDKGWKNQPVPGLVHKTAKNKAGFPVHYMTSPDGAGKYFWYTDAAGNLRILRGNALKAAAAMRETAQAEQKRSEAKAHELRKKHKK